MPCGEFKHRYWFFADTANIARNCRVIWKDLILSSDSYRLLKYRGRVSDPDPDPHGSALIWAAGSGSAYKLRIRIRIQEGKNYQKKIEKRKEFSSFEVLDVLFWGLKASPVAWASFMEA